jgi:glutamyl-tRNA reductase
LRIGFGPLPVVSNPHIKTYEGVSAYQRLLRISAGLCSHLPGETNVFGQIKKVLSGVQAQDEHLKSMAPKLFEDTKFIRTQFLRGVGSHVYGQAVQQLVEEQKSHVRSILVLGAGDMAKNVAPCLRADDIWLYNRTPHRSIELKKNLEKAGQRAHVVTEQQELDELISSADVIVIGLPPLLQEETHFVQSISSSTEQMVIHLGRREQDCGPWMKHQAYFSLDDVFDYGSSQTLHLRNQLADAAEACATRASLRALGEGVFTAHGWEDMHIVAKAPAWCSAA